MATPLKFSGARYRAVSDRPYLAAALWAMIPVAKPGLGTLAVDKYWRCYYDPVAIEKWSLEELSGVLLHEVGHLLRDHSERADCMGASVDLATGIRWNIAADCEINDDLATEGIKLPTFRDKGGKPIGNCVYPKTYDMPDFRLCEEYYNLLENKIKVEYIDVTYDAAGNATVTKSDAGAGVGDGSKPGDGNGSSPKPSSGQPSPSPDPKHVITIYRIHGKPQPGAGQCGSAASGRHEPWEDGPPDGSSTPGITDSEGKNVRREVARQILESSKSRGCVPDGWRRWAEDLLTPKVDWRKELAAMIRNSLAETMGAIDYSRRKPSRRQSAYGDCIMPALRRPVPNIAVGIDTSGSMGDQKICQAIAEISGVLKECGATGVTVASVDAAVHDVKKVFKARDIVPLGGGGTDMRVLIEHFHKIKPRPQTLIVLTDAETPWPPEKPSGMDVIIGLIGTGDCPAWAKVVKITDD